MVSLAGKQGLVVLRPWPEPAHSCHAHGGHGGHAHGGQPDDDDGLFCGKEDHLLGCWQASLLTLVSSRHLALECNTGHM